MHLDISCMRLDINPYTSWPIRPMYDANLKRGPALFGLSWDGGQASKRRSYTPIIVSVGNTDSASSDTCFCIGYLPTLDNSDSEVRRVLVQRCIGSILEVLDDNSERGFTCILADEQGLEHKWHLYPILTRVELDTKERYKFFGCSRQRACGIGSGPRRGRSVLRKCTRHSQRYVWVNVHASWYYNIRLDILHIHLDWFCIRLDMLQYTSWYYDIRLDIPHASWYIVCTSWYDNTRLDIFCIRLDMIIHVLIYFAYFLIHV